MQLSIDPGRGVRLVQRHLFRVERDHSLTHIVATIDEGRRDHLEHELARCLGGFRVDAVKNTGN